MSLLILADYLIIDSEYVYIVATKVTATFLLFTYYIYFQLHCNACDSYTLETILQIFIN